jgi:hypothetical protein
MGAEGAGRVAERYRIDRLVDDIDELYRELLGGAGLPLPPLTPSPAPGRG